VRPFFVDVLLDEFKMTKKQNGIIVTARDYDCDTFDDCTLRVSTSSD
jgi:hypothetical protein